MMLVTSDLSYNEIARRCALHPGYVRKLTQRMVGTDSSWSEWRQNNPQKVREFRQRQDRTRRQNRAALATARRTKAGAAVNEGLPPHPEPA